MARPFIVRIPFDQGGESGNYHFVQFPGTPDAYQLAGATSLALGSTLSKSGSTWTVFIQGSDAFFTATAAATADGGFPLEQASWTDASSGLNGDFTVLLAEDQVSTDVSGGTLEAGAATSVTGIYGNHNTV
jgi:hypothetical protein